MSINEPVVSGAGAAQLYNNPHDSLADEGPSQPAKKRKVSEKEGSTAQKVRPQDFYVKKNRSEVLHGLALNAMLRSC